MTKHKFLVIALTSLLLFCFSAFQTQKSENEKVKAAFLVELDALINETHKFNASLSALNQTQEPYITLRRKFKRCEWLMAHFDQALYLNRINGAPLPKLEKNVPGIRVLQPKGMQVIDEMMSDTNLDIEALQEEVTLISEAFAEFKLHFLATEVTNELLLESMQKALIRLFTMGITGFDTPGSQLGIVDSKNVLEGMSYCLLLTDVKIDAGFLNELSNNISYLVRHDDFVRFNRLEYYKKYWQPLYARCVDLRDETILNASALLHVNPLEKHLFSDNFLNKTAFMDFSRSNYNSNTIELGRTLFFDASLSRKGNMSCGTCHQPDKAFTDGNIKSLSNDFKTPLQRNAPTLINSVYTTALFYDFRAAHLSQQLEHVIFSEGEFNTSLVEILDKLKTSDYVGTFARVFPEHATNPVNPYTFRTAISAYVASLTDINSTFDKYMRGEVSDISKQAKLGYNLFMGKANCATCHFAPVFSGLVPPYYNDSESEVLGVPSDILYSKIDEDLGRFNPSKIKETVDFYKHSFKTQTIRKIKYTAPYMHNGVFATLEELMEFYNNGGGIGHKLDVPHQTLSGNNLNLNKKEIAAVIEFMKLLE